MPRGREQKRKWILLFLLLSAIVLLWRLAEIQQMEDVFTVRVYLAFFGLAFLTILPSLISRWQERTSSNPPH